MRKLRQKIKWKKRLKMHEIYRKDYLCPQIRDVTMMIDGKYQLTHSANGDR